MKEFEPSAGFVVRVMQAVDAADPSARLQPAGQDHVPFTVLRAALATGGGLLGLLNLLRLWFSVFSPAICQ